MKVELRYGRDFVSLRIPERNIAQVIRPWQDDSNADNRTLVQQAISGVSLERFRGDIAGRRLCVLVDDGTRDEAFEEMFEKIFAVLRESLFVRFLISTGTHNPDTPLNDRIITHIEQAARRTGIGQFDIHAHDCDCGNFTNAGVTSRGTDIICNSLADDADAFLVLSDVKIHYFAGYSNPIKNFVPGICAFRTAEQNHSLALDEKSTFGIHPWHSDAGRRDNPLADDQLEGMRLIVRNRPVHALAAITTSRQIRWAGFGPVEDVSREAFDIVDQRNTHTVEPVERLIVSPGGMPNDIDLYIAQRALELTKNAVTDGGEILFLAACPNGIGEEKTMENFYNRLTLPIDDVLESIKSEYKLYSHKPYKFAQMIRRMRRIWVHSQVSGHLLEAAHLFPAQEPQAVIDDWLAERPDARIIIVDGANKIALYDGKPSS